MSSVPHLPGTSGTSATHESSTPHAQTEHTPRSRSNGDGKNKGYLPPAGAYIPEGVANYFTKSGDPQPSTPTPSSAASDADDETMSTTTDLTELSTRAQAGSDVPSGPASPASTASFNDLPTEGEAHSPDASRDASETEADTEQEKKNTSPWLEQDYASAAKPSPPEINLEPRTHPLAAGDASHGGVLLCEDAQVQLDQERAEGTLSPAYDNADGAAARATDEEDDYSSDEGKEDAQGGKAKRLARRVKGGAKVISGKIWRDPERVEEGKDLISQQ
ncbi:hypothetical protein B0H11DRAFT_1955187 [Mycena galericulata]|nr:hypothetical protein B0H11DRAFT_1955187 [Mycena galericulata]